MIIVSDTNVLISGLIFPGGNPDRIIKSFLLGHFQNAISPDIVTELKRVLGKKMHMPPDDVSTLTGLVIANSLMVYPEERLSAALHDETDNRVLECAVTARAEYLVTGDKKHLLPLKKFKGIRIVSPAEFCIRQGIRMG